MCEVEQIAVFKIIKIGLFYVVGNCGQLGQKQFIDFFDLFPKVPVSKKS